LSIGTVLTAPIYDSGPRRSKLLGEQIEINEQFIKQLEARGVYSVSVSKRDLAAMEAGQPQGRLRKVSDHQYAASRLVTSRSRDIDDEIRCGEIRSSVEGSTDGPPIPAPSTRYDREAVTAEVARREQQVVYMDGLFQSLVRDDPSSADGLSDVCRSSIKAIVGDKDLFLALGLNPFSCDYPSRHSLHVCSVAIAIGVSLSLDDQSLIDLGTGCLVHDVGMLKLDRQIYKAKRDLSRRELIMLADHPVLTLDALACPGVSLSREARLVAYQIHERCDGSGYPRGTRADEIHQLSKIAAVADAYVGLVSNRWHRSGLIPYFAIEKILKSIPQGLYDAKVVRALLNTISLFPIGSFIETNDGRVGRVVRATGGTYTKPVIELWNNRHRQFEPDLVDLSKDSSIWVHRAVSTPGYV
tara:strand:- start:16893 stop:18131 length:1239 start_codon:yes stop_codon:yes gene_type:complete